MADCERKHGQHKAMCSAGNGHPVTFMNMLVNSVNDEVRHLTLRLQRDAKDRAKRFSQQCLADGDIQPPSRTTVENNGSLFVMNLINKSELNKGIHS